MSAYQMVAATVYRGVGFSGFKASFWKWWVGLYAEPPHRLPPTML